MDASAVEDTTTEYDPASAFAVNSDDFAMPAAFVVCWFILDCENDALAPDNGVVKVTLAPGTGLPQLSSTATSNGNLKAKPGGVR
jgi:hypothetical protein